VDRTDFWSYQDIQTGLWNYSFVLRAIKAPFHLHVDLRHYKGRMLLCKKWEEAFKNRFLSHFHPQLFLHFSQVLKLLNIPKWFDTYWPTNIPNIDIVTLMNFSLYSGHSRYGICCRHSYLVCTAFKVASRLSRLITGRMLCVLHATPPPPLTPRKGSHLVRCSQRQREREIPKEVTVLCNEILFCRLSLFHIAKPPSDIHTHPRKVFAEVNPITRRRLCAYSLLFKLDSLTERIPTVWQVRTFPAAVTDPDLSRIRDRYKEARVLIQNKLLQ
jgi:hypothetical protein